MIEAKPLKEIAKLTGYTVERLRRLCQSGEVKAYRGGSSRKARWYLTEQSVIKHQNEVMRNRHNR
jgi:hypothetical protein